MAMQEDCVQGLPTSEQRAQPARYLSLTVPCTDQTASIYCSDYIKTQGYEKGKSHPDFESNPIHSQFHLLCKKIKPLSRSTALSPPPLGHLH